MNTLSKFKSATLDSIGRRILKVLEFGAKTAKESSPFGVDSSPLPEMTAIYSKTSNDSESVIIGYIQRNQISKPGESRLFSLDSDGVLKAFVYCTDDGKLQLNGDGFTAVRFAPLNTAQNAMVLAINTELGKIASGIATAGGSYIVAPIQLDLSGAESSTVKLK